MIPNIAGAMATSPVLISSLVGLFGNVHGGSFTEAQVQIVLLTDAVVNACTWAVAFHTALALKEGIDPADVQVIREGIAIVAASTITNYTGSITKPSLETMFQAHAWAG